MEEKEAMPKFESTYAMQTRMISGQLRPTGVPLDELDETNPEAILLALRKLGEIARLPALKGWMVGVGRRIGAAYRGEASGDYPKPDTTR